jgi:hypothetical protein
MEERSRFDYLWIGLSVGIFIPFLALLMFYYSSFTKVSFQYFIEYSSQIRILPKVISLCVIPNLGVFFLFIWREHYYSARGIVMATLIITFFVLGLKIFI